MAKHTPGGGGQELFIISYRLHYLPHSQVGQLLLVGEWARANFPLKIMVHSLHQPQRHTNTAHMVIVCGGIEWSVCGEVIRCVSIAHQIFIRSITNARGTGWLHTEIWNTNNTNNNNNNNNRRIQINMELSFSWHARNADRNVKRTSNEFSAISNVRTLGFFLHWSRMESNRFLCV